MLNATRNELSKLYSRWTIVAPYGAIAVALLLVAWNVSKLGGPIGLSPESSILIYFPLIMWWLPALFVIVSSAGAMGAEFEGATIRTLLVTPLSRRQLLASKFLALALHAIAITAFAYAVSTGLRAVLFNEHGMPLHAGNETAIELLRPDQHPVRLLVGWEATRRLLLCYGYLAFLLCALAAVTLLVATVTRHTMGSISVTAAAVALMWFAALVQPLAPIRPALLSDQARAWIWIASGIPQPDRLVAATTCVACYLAGSLLGAWAALERRDVDV